MWRRLLIAGVLTLASGEVRAADILELLKTHKIILSGDTCSDKGSTPCNPPPMNAQSEIRRVNDLLFLRSLVSGTGEIYPVGREEDIRSHPLMKEYFRRRSFKYLHFKTQAIVSGDALVLKRKESYEVNPRGMTVTFSITIRDKACEALGDGNYRWRCELVPLEVGEKTPGGPRVQTLSFSRLAKDYGGKRIRQDHEFTLLNDRLHYKAGFCADQSELTVQFDWRGGALKGTHGCKARFTDVQQTLTYRSLTKTEGNGYHLTASGRQRNVAGLKTDLSFELDIRIKLVGGRCQVEKFYWKVSMRLHGIALRPQPFIYSADSESECFLD
jgi:hypothetical protein